MNRRTKAILAVVLCVIPIAGVYIAWSQPLLRRHQQFDTSAYIFEPWELNVSLPVWLYDEFVVYIEVTDYSGFLLAGSVHIRTLDWDPIEQISIPGIGNYTTNWIPIQGDICIRINNPTYGSLEGEIWVWARYSYFRFWYGE